MYLLNKLLSACAILMLGIITVYAQDGKKIREQMPANIGDYDNRCKSCDSVGDAYLYAGDTSAALYYYRLYLEAYPDDAEIKHTLIKQNRLFNKRQSFYLSDY